MAPETVGRHATRHLSATVADDDSAYDHLLYKVLKLDGTTLSSGQVDAVGEDVVTPQSAETIEVGEDTDGDGELKPAESTHYLKLATATSELTLPGGNSVDFKPNDVGTVIVQRDRTVQGDIVAQPPVKTGGPATPAGGRIAVIQKVDASTGAKFTIKTTGLAVGETYTIKFVDPTKNNDPVTLTITIR